MRTKLLLPAFLLVCVMAVYVFRAGAATTPTPGGAVTWQIDNGNGALLVKVDTAIDSNKVIWTTDPNLILFEANVAVLTGTVNGNLTQARVDANTHATALLASHNTIRSDANTNTQAVLAQATAAATAAKNGDYVISAVYEANANGNSMLLIDPNCSALATFPATTVLVGLVPRATDTVGSQSDLIDWNYGAAVHGSHQVPIGSAFIKTTSTLANTIQVITESNVACKFSIYVGTPRN